MDSRSDETGDPYALTRSRELATVAGFTFAVNT
jgi:hypothetical protein